MGNFEKSEPTYKIFKVHTPRAVNPVRIITVAKIDYEVGVSPQMPCFEFWLKSVKGYRVEEYLTTDLFAREAWEETEMQNIVEGFDRYFNKWLQVWVECRNIEKGS